MKTLTQFVRTTLVGGLFFLAPIVVLIVILAKAFDFAKKGLNAVFVHIPAASELSPGAATVLSVDNRRARLPSCRARGPHRDRATPRQPVGVFAAVEDSGLRLPEAGERERAGRRRDRGASRGLRAHGRGMAARRSNRSAERRLRHDLRPRRAEPAFRVGLFLFEGQRSTCRHQAGRRTQLPQAMRRGRFRDRRQLAGQARNAPRSRREISGRSMRKHLNGGNANPGDGRPRIEAAHRRPPRPRPARRSE